MSPKSDRPESPARKRAVDHMKRLLKTTALTGAALTLGACESCGPVVCDPLPPPVACGADGGLANLQESVSVTASWKQGGADPVGELKLNIYDDYGALVIAGDAALTRATAVEQQHTETSLTVSFKPEAGQSAAFVTVPVTCRGAANQIELRLDLSGQPAVGAAIPVAIIE